MTTEVARQEPTPGPVVTVRRVFEEWALADNAPIEIAELDRLLLDAIHRMRRTP